MKRLRLLVALVAVSPLLGSAAAIAEFEWTVYKLNRAYAANIAELDRSEVLISSSLTTAAHTRGKLEEILEMIEQANSK